MIGQTPASGGGSATLDTNTATSGLSGMLKADADSLANAVAGVDFLAPDAELTAIAGLTSAADKAPYFTGSGTAALFDLTSFARTLLDDADAATARATLGLGTAATAASSSFEAAGAVSTHAGLTSGVHGISAFGASLLDDADAATARATLGLGSSSSPTFAGLTLSAGTLTTSTPFAFSQTWNNSGVTFDGLTFDVTNTASNASSLLANFRVGGSSIFRLARNGSVQIAGTSSFETYSAFGSTRSWLVFDGGGSNVSMQFGSNGSINFNTASDAGAAGLNLRYGGSVGVLQLGTLHATTATAQTIRAHGVTTGTGASLTLQGGSGSSARGNVVLHGGNRAAYDDAPSTTVIRDILISHGLMAAS